MELSGVHRRAELHAAGYSDVELRQLLRAGRLMSVRRGTYLSGQWPDDADRRHALATRATVERLGVGAVCSHVTAAVVHGLPVWRIPLDRVHVTRSRRSGWRRSAVVMMHAAPLDPDEIDLVAGLPVTSVARTVLDIARTVPFEQAVVVADAALRGDEARRPSGDRAAPWARSAGGR